MVYQLLSKAFQIVFPASCLACNTHTDNKALCRKCCPKLPDLADRCEICFKECYNKSICSVCEVKKSDFKKIRYLWQYDEHSRLLIKTAKYSPSYQLCKILGQYLSKHFQELFQETKFDLIVPVPASYKNLQFRKFNQTNVLAQSIYNDGHAKKVLFRALQKKHSTPPQAKIKDLRARIKNVKNSFYVTHDLSKYNNILLLDDVITTGATTKAAAKALFDAGAKNLYLLALAQSKYRDELRYAL